MKNKLIVCHSCLSTNRTLFPIKKLQDLLLNVELLDLNLDYEGAVCWECKRIIIKLSRFKKQVELAQISLHQAEKPQILQCLSTLSCTDSSTYSYNYLPSNPDIKSDSIDIQSEEIKQEADEANDFSDHNEDEKPSLDSDVNAEDKELKKEITKSKEHIQEKEIRKERKKIKKKVKKPKVKKKKKIENTISYDDIKEKPKVKNKKKIENTVSYDDIKDKFIEVEFTEEEMMKNREEKRGHPNFKKLPYNCETCVLGFTRIENYDLHKEKKHNVNIGRHICPVCQVHFASRATLIKHVRKHYHSYRCKLCTYETSELWSAVSHSQNKHSGDSEDSIHCKQCSYVAKCREELSEHMKSEHSLICKECGEKFKGPNTLKTHIRRIHGSVREHKCSECRRAFRSRGRLDAHMATHGPAAAARLAYCAVCRLQYKSLYVYRNHLRTSAAHSERRFHCEVCGKKFASKVYYKRHYTFYHQKESKFKCELCDRLFISAWRLRTHHQLRHGAARARDHACDQCGRSFYTASTLKAHQLTHSSQRSFMCAHCGDTFRQRPALYTHMRRLHPALKTHTT